MSDSYRFGNAQICIQMVTKLFRDILNSFRFSISWSRVLPSGDASKPNEEGVNFYRRYIDAVLRNGMEPMVTMYHFDHPFSLEKELNGWGSPAMVDKFVEYAGFLFKTFGQKVKYWVTMNEPNNYCVYFPTVLATLGLAPADEDVTYRCMHHMNLAHARAYRLYKETYYDSQKGRVGSSVLVWPAVPASTRSEDVLASDAFMQLFSGTVVHPLVYGDYSEATRFLVDMRNAERGLTESRLPFFNETEKQLLQGGATDFIALNVYNSYTVAYDHGTTGGDRMPRLLRAIEDDLPFVRMAAGDEYDETGADEFVMHDALMWTWNAYHLPIAVTENGFADVKSLWVKDTVRAAFHSTNLRSLMATMKQYDVQVFAYYAWALLDIFEFTAGFSRNFGLVHVDYDSGSLNRTLKYSSTFFREMMESGRVPYVQPPGKSHSSTVSPSGILLFALATCAFATFNKR
ncbi:lactase-phlorizin hydrolase-like isoform X2 [Thrips palmi]|uniref:Lactase-phlorizin hydrolase-like isoform X2 n=1 Tax=Thrips palmi TaxID=161013 RepID=A0A6P8YZJ1_THRPL|nr:lactase-phlorizin hydrolase-like isoform X2 [Thrips palmi]